MSVTQMRGHCDWIGKLAARFLESSFQYLIIIKACVLMKMAVQHATNRKHCRHRRRWGGSTTPTSTMSAMSSRRCGRAVLDGVVGGRE